MKFHLLLLICLSCTSKNSDGQRNPASSLELVKQYSIPGIAGATFQENSSPIHFIEGVKKWGYSSLLEKDDVFHLGSCTKAMTASLAATLVDEGILTWKMTLRELLPDLNIHPEHLNTSFETLLVHRAGLPSSHFVFHEVKNMDALAGRELIAKRILKEAPLTKPDSHFSYTNYGYILAGYILERLTNESWEDLMVNRIFRPLKMDSCGFGVTSDLSENTPLSVWGHEKKLGQISPRHFDNPPAFGPSSVVHCSLTDWGKFLYTHMKGFRGENKFHSPESFIKLHSRHPSGDSSYTYGGWNLLQRNWANGLTLSHAGSNTLNYAKVWIAPYKKTVFVSTANIGGDEAMAATDALIQKMLKIIL